MLIVIVRHGKAEKDSPSGGDRDRPLKPRGEKQAQYLATKLADMPVEAIVSSDAVRARDTARPIAAALDIDVDFDQRLRVDMPVSSVVDLIAQRAQGPLASGLMLVGHNPQLSKLVGLLAGKPTGPALEELRTGQAAVLEIDRQVASDPSALKGAAELQSILRSEA